MTEEFKVNDYVTVPEAANGRITYVGKYGATVRFPGGYEYGFLFRSIRPFSHLDFSKRPLWELLGEMDEVVEDVRKAREILSAAFNVPPPKDAPLADVAAALVKDYKIALKKAFGKR